MILDIQKVKGQIRRIARKGVAGIALTRHCRVRMKEKKVDIIDILNVLNWGEVVHDPGEHAEMKFKVQGHDLDGEPLCVVVILLDQESLLGITVHG
ncbi:MAG: DUF4258 domain-containing protein [Thermodesulfobacteriota bacterium]